MEKKMEDQVQKISEDLKPEKKARVSVSRDGFFGSGQNLFHRTRSFQEGKKELFEETVKLNNKKP